MCAIEIHILLARVGGFGDGFLCVDACLLVLVVVLVLTVVVTVSMAGGRNYVGAGNCGCLPGCWLTGIQEVQ